jgi:hypothetical protein
MKIFLFKTITYRLSILGQENSIRANVQAGNLWSGEIIFL